MADYGFSSETIEWLAGWFSGGREITKITDSVKKELESYIPDDFVTLYRGLKKGDLVKDGEIRFDFISSWTYNPDMARNFADDEISFIKIIVSPKDILFDSTFLDKVFIIGELGGFPDEEEVILKAGVYRIVE